MCSSFSIGPSSPACPPAAPSAPPPSLPPHAARSNPTELTLSPSPNARQTNSRRESPPCSSCETRRSISLRLSTGGLPSCGSLAWIAVRELYASGRRSAKRAGRAALAPLGMTNRAQTSTHPVPHPVVPAHERQEPGAPAVQWDRPEPTQVGRLTRAGQRGPHPGAEPSGQSYPVPAIPQRVVHSVDPPRV